MHARPSPQPPPPSSARPIVVVSPLATDREALFAEFEARFGAALQYLPGVVQAARSAVLRTASAIVVSPAVAAEDLDTLLDLRAHEAPALPLFVLRNPRADVPARWAQAGVGVLRCPLLPEALSRSVEVVLGLSNRAPRKAGAP